MNGSSIKPVISIPMVVVEKKNIFYIFSETMNTLKQANEKVLKDEFLRRFVNSDDSMDWNKALSIASDYVILEYRTTIK